MFSDNYQKIRELKLFLKDKINNSPSLKKKYKTYQIIKIISLLIGYGSIFIFSVHIFHRLYLQNYDGLGTLMINSLIPISINTFLLFLIPFLDKNQNNLSVEYTNTDYENLTNILSYNEMEKFMQENEDFNTLKNYKDFLANIPEVKPEIIEDDSILLAKQKKQKRKEYLDSLYSLKLKPGENKK